MTKVKQEKAEQDAFSDRADNVELGQGSANRDGWLRFFRRLILVLLPITLAHCLVLLYLHRWTLSVKHTHRLRFGPAAEHAFLYVIIGSFKHILTFCYRSIPNPKNAIKLSHQYAGKPHVAGTDRDFQTADLFLVNLQESLGIPRPEQRPVFDAGSPESQAATRGIMERDSPYAWIDTYYPVMNTPVDHALQIVEDDGSVLWDADLTEHAPEGDDYAVRYADAVPAFHGMSFTGDVTGHLIYGNYCSKEVWRSLI
jgi:N-acetylated-alpha-linked acidic dipeptidase